MPAETFHTSEHTKPAHAPLPRRVYMVLSPRSLPYARLTISSLFQQCDDALDLRFITDSGNDKQVLCDAVRQMQPDARHTWSVTAEDELANAEATTFAHHPNVRAFRHGHPCWRKITDPVLLATPGEEMVLLDPDLYFPNRFRFEATPASGLLLMRQRPNCLLPPEVVRKATAARIPLARHVDIGVSHWRLGNDLAELDWLEWLIGKLGGASLPRMMHVEAIVWAAIAMRFGGGYLDPNQWVCWQRTQGKRVRRKLGVAGTRLLASEPWQQMKCFHAGGEAKGWLPAAVESGVIRGGAEHVAAGRILPFVELTSSRYEKEQTVKELLGGLGYYRLFGAGRT